MKDAAKTTGVGPSKPSPGKTTSSGADQDEMTPSIIGVGDTVLHAKFGKGKVVALEGTSPNEKATVFFPSVGQKQLLLKFAKLEVIG